MIAIDNRYNFNIILVGCGGTGGQLLPSLLQLCHNVNKKINKVILVDGDHFEPHNCINQRCLEEEVGENKAEALAERWNYIYEDLDICYYADYIRTQKDLISIIPGGLDSESTITILIGAVDRNSSRIIFDNVFHLAKEKGHKMVYIDSGNGDIDRVGQVITGFTMNKEILLNPVAKYFPEIYDDTEDLTKLQNCTNAAKSKPQNIATNVFAATLIFSVITNIIMFGKIEKGVIYFDADKHTIFSR